MPDPDIFNDEPNPGANPDDKNTGTTSMEDLLKNIVNENGEQKYKDIPTALKALQHSQQFIDTLKSEKHSAEQQLQTVKAELEKVGSVEDVVKKLFDDRPEPKEPNADPQQVTGLDENKAKELFSQLLEQRSQEERQAANLSTVTSKLSELYGDKAGEMIKAKAQELGSTTEELKNLSANNPSLVLALFDSKAVPPSKTPSNSAVIPPHQPPEDDKLAPPETSLLRGASSKDLAAYWDRVRQDVYKRHNIET